MGNIPQIYFIYPYDCPLSHVFINKIVKYFSIDSKTHLGRLIERVKINEVPMYRLGLNLEEQLKRVKESDVVVLFWTPLSYKRNNIVKHNIAFELKELGKIFYEISLIPILISDADPEILVKKITSKIAIREDKKFINDNIRKSIKLEIKSNYSEETLTADTHIIYNSIIDSLFIPLKVRKNLRGFFQRTPEHYLNDILDEFDGGFYFTIKDTRADYATILLEGLRHSNKQFIATLKREWFEEIFRQKDSITPNLEYLKEIRNKKSQYKHYLASRFIIDTKNDPSFLIKDSKKFDDFMNVHQGINLYYLSVQKLKNYLAKRLTRLRFEDFAVFDDTLVIKSDTKKKYVFSQFLNRGRYLDLFYQELLKINKMGEIDLKKNGFMKVQGIEDIKQYLEADNV